jgi:hypothetical protein
LLLGGLTAWHAKLISKGETSIEAHINRNETKRLKALGQVGTQTGLPDGTFSNQNIQIWVNFGGP